MTDGYGGPKGLPFAIGRGQLCGTVYAPEAPLWVRAGVRMI